MATIEGKIKEMLLSHNMFESQAAAVVEMMKADKANEDMKGRWEDDVEGYSPQLLLALRFSARRCALQYIDTNCPKARFRPLFAGDEEE